MPIGHGVGYNLFHREDRHGTAKKVLNGDLDWEHPMEEVNDFIKNLAISYNEEALAEESCCINAVITAKEF